MRKEQLRWLVGLRIRNDHPQWLAALLRCKRRALLGFYVFLSTNMRSSISDLAFRVASFRVTGAYQRTPGYTERRGAS